MAANQHYAALLGLGDEWTVTNVTLDVPGKRVDVYVEYAQKSAICPVCGELAGLHDRLEESVGTDPLKRLSTACFIMSRAREDSHVREGTDPMWPGPFTPRVAVPGREGSRTEPKG